MIIEKDITQFREYGGLQFFHLEEERYGIGIPF